MAAPTNWHGALCFTGQGESSVLLLSGMAGLCFLVGSERTASVCPKGLSREESGTIHRNSVRSLALHLGVMRVRVQPID